MTLYGWGYVRNTCISLFRKEMEEKAYRFYIANCLQVITKNTAMASGGNYISKSLNEILNPPKARSKQEIINTLKAKCDRIREG